MHLVKLSVPLAILALAAAACDGDNTGSTATDSDASANDPNAGIATQPAGNTATQPAGNTATQPAGNTATQPAGNTATPSGTSSGSVDCATVCGHIVGMGCLEQAECAAICPVFTVTGTCQSLSEALARCAMAASNCDALDACETQADALDACVDGGTVEPDDPPPTTTTPTISDTANCYTSNVCTGCTSPCDTCVCGYLYLDYSSAEIATNCGTICSSSG